MRGLFLACACVCILAVGLICAFLFANGLPFFSKYSLIDFITGTEWAPLRGVFGILPTIVGSFYVTFGALLLGAPIGILTAVLMSLFAGSRVVRVMKPCVALLAGIPSVVYGFFGLMLLVPFVRNTFGGQGKSILVASILLVIMILPTVIQTAEAALRLVDAVEETILERSTCAEAFEKMPIKADRQDPYYRIYVDNYIVFYVVIGDVMEVRRTLYGRRDLPEHIR